MKIVDSEPQDFNVISFLIIMIILFVISFFVTSFFNNDVGFYSENNTNEVMPITKHN